MTNIFDGKKFAKRKLIEVKKKVLELKKKGITPKLVSIVVGDEKGALFYQKLKKKKAKEVGIRFVINKYLGDANFDDIKNNIKKLNSDDSVQGIMIQLPLPENLRERNKDLIDCIDPKKDVDGMRDGSSFTSPVVQAVDTAILVSQDWLQHNNCPYKIVIVGSEGFEGSKILRFYLHENKQNSFLPIGVDKNSEFFEKKVKEADILISVTGTPNLIKSDMIKDGVVLIDVGSPRGDIDKKVYDKANFVSPVPGGIGPLTIAYLMENIMKSAKGNN